MIRVLIIGSGCSGVSIKRRGKYKSLTEQERKLLKRRQAIEPIIGHLKSDNRMNRCHLKGPEGDAIHAVLCAAGYNIRWLLRMIRKRGLGLYVFSQEDLDAVAWALNTRPRKSLGFKCPAELFLPDTFNADEYYRRLVALHV
jgi:hypothetical protein